MLSTSQLRLITDADDIHLLREARRHPGNRVRHQRARQPVQRRLIIVLAFGDEVILVELEGDPFRDRWSSPSLSGPELPPPNR